MKGVFHFTQVKALAILFIPCVMSAADPSGARTEVPLLHVSGRGEVMVPPDRAVVRLAVEMNADEAAAAQSQVNEVLTKTIAGIRKAGVAEQDIQTSGISLTPIYSKLSPGKEGPASRIAQYRAATSIEIRLQDVQSAGSVIDAGLKAGANRLEGISFELKDDLAARMKALRIAVREAKTKAEAIAAEQGVKIRQVREIVEEGVQLMPQPRFARAEMATMSMAPTEVQPGELRIQASVIVRYEIGP